jgi:hypothetical protein
MAGIACALERARLANASYPPTLESLSPALIKTIPRDVISGGPLKYKLRPDGSFLLYSVGWNETDDGGVVAMGHDKAPHVDTGQGDWVWPQYPAR